MLGNWSNSLDHLVHLLVAFILAFPIGWHRAREERSAGLRTFPLVAMASYGFVQTAVSLLGAGIVNQANIMQGVITGVGFIGAGAIIKEGSVTRHSGQHLGGRDHWRCGWLRLLRYRAHPGRCQSRRSFDPREISGRFSRAGGC
jgi:hypothetical protein